MAKRQYRVTTESNWTSNFGYAFLALMNQSGSGRRLTLRSLEVQVATAFCDVAGAPAPSSLVTLYRSSITAPLDGEAMDNMEVPLNSASVKPSTVVVRRGGSIPSYANVLRQHDLGRRGGAVGTQNMPWCHMQIGRIGTKQRNGGYFTPRNNLGTEKVEPFVVAQNEAFALVGSNKLRMTTPVRCGVHVTINGKLFVWDFVSIVKPGINLWSVENTGTDLVEIVGYNFAELGTTDTPYIRVVPVGQLYSGDVADSPKKQLSVTKMDSSQPDLTALAAYTDIGFIPKGVPEKYIADGAPATAVPKGFNYLHTKDFDGPVFRTFLPEFCDMYRGAGLAGGDSLRLPLQQRFADLLVQKSGITILPGEGLALVSSAETAAGVQAAYSGWPSLIFTAVIDDEPETIPTIGATGMVEGSRYRVERVSDSSEVVSGVAGPSGSFSFEYTTEDTPLNLRLKVRKSSAAPLYKPYEVVFYLTSTGASVPVTQIPDD